MTDQFIPTKGLRVMADHGSSGIWAIGEAPPPWRHGMIGCDTLGLDPELASRFEEWIAWYERDQLEGRLDIAVFDQAGLELAQALKRAVGRTMYVEFAPEPRDGKAVPSIPIE